MRKFIKNRERFVESLESQMDVPKIIWDIHSIFREYGYKLYLVGGSVRDFIAKDTPKDFDVATDATPDKIIEMFKDKFGVRKEKGKNEFQLNNRWRVNLQGDAFGVVVIYIPGEKEGVEIASFNTRHDGKIVLGVTIEDDVERRDLTFNALFYDLDKKEIIDLVGGVEDLKNKRLRMVGDPNKRIIDDPIRIQRLFRFGPRYDAEMNQETKDAINSHKHLYREPTAERPNGVSQERIVDEFQKAFYSLKEKFTQYIDYLDEFEMWGILFPGISFTKSPKYVSTERLPIALAQLLVNESDNIFKSVMVREWKLSGDLTNMVQLLVNLTKVTNIKQAMNVRSFQLRFPEGSDSHVSNNTVVEFLNIMELNDPIYDKMLKYDPSQIVAIDVMNELGMEHEDGKLKDQRKDGSTLGKELNKRRIELFKSL